MKQYVIVVLICIFLITDDIKHLFYVLISNLYIFFGEMFMKPFFHF